MARGIRTSSGRGGRVPAPGGGYHGTSCPESCCGACAHVYRARACSPNIVFPPGFDGECIYTPPPDIFICQGVLCSATNQPIQPGDVIIVNGVCYEIMPGVLPVAAADGSFLYTDPTVECSPLGCSNPGCLSSPWGRAIPCDPDCPPGPYFCRAQVPHCVTIAFFGTNGLCCYRFDPGRPASVPDGARICLLERLLPGYIPPGWPNPECEGILFDPDQDFSIFPRGIESCCECEDGCAITNQQADPDVVCDPGAPILPRCCRTVPAGAEVVVSATTTVSVYSNDVLIQEQRTEDSATLVGIPPPDGTSTSQTWYGDYHQEFFFNGQPNGTNSAPARVDYCPLSIPVSHPLGERLLPPARGWIELDQNGVDENGWLGYCLESIVRPWYIRNHWRHDRRDQLTLSGAVIEVEYTIRIVPTPRNPPIPCRGGCFGSQPQPTRPGPIGIIPAPVPGAPLMAESQGSEQGTITVRGGGSRDTGKVNVAELL